MIEKLVYVASQFPGEKLVREITSKFDHGTTDIPRWLWSFQIANLSLLLHLLEKHLGDGEGFDELHRFIKRELVESSSGQSARVGDLVVAEDELRYLATHELAVDSAADTTSLARLMLDYRLPRLRQALAEAERLQTLESLPPDHSAMTYLVKELLQQVKGEGSDTAVNQPLITAVENLMDEYCRHMEGQIDEYFRVT